MIATSEAALDAIEKSPRTYAAHWARAPTERATARATATEQLELSMSVVEHLDSVATTSALREAYNSVLPSVSAVWSSIALRDTVYLALQELLEDEPRLAGLPRGPTTFGCCPAWRRIKPQWLRLSLLQ